MMGSDDLFYGNLNLRQKEIMNDLLPKYSDVVDHFTAYEFIYPNKNTTYKEVVELNNRVRQVKDSPLLKDYKAQDTNLWKYLEKISLDFGLSKSDYKRILNFIQSEIAPIVISLKDFWNRARPYQYAYVFELNYHPYPTISGHSASYPSGHTIETEVWGYLCKQKLPNKKSNIDSVVNTINESRLNLGVHFPSDIYFSKEVFDYLVKNNYLTEQS